MELVEEPARKLESPLGAPRVTKQSRRHGSSARYVHDSILELSAWGGL